MSRSLAYNGALTAEQFLFYEMRIVAPMYLDHVPVKEATEIILSDNLFQYPTEREVGRKTRACYRRLSGLNNETLVSQLAEAPSDIAKQINLYAIMRDNLLVWEFIINIIGEKYRSQDFTWSRQDMNAFFSDLQARSTKVASWSEKTVNRIKGVLLRMLIETEYLDDKRDTTLNQIFISEELEQGIRANGDLEALPAFNCFR